MPSGATRASRLAFSIEVSGLDTDLPANADNAPSFDPKSKLASSELANRTGPVMMGLSTGPVIASSTDSVPPFSCDPEGSTTPIEGNIVSSSSTGMLGALSFRSTTSDSPFV